jgi:hypothetical protein
MTKILILPDIKIENPYSNKRSDYPKDQGGYKYYVQGCAQHKAWEECQLSILSHVKEIDIDALYKKYRQYEKTWFQDSYPRIVDKIPFSQFIEQMEKKINKPKDLDNHISNWDTVFIPDKQMEDKKDGVM